jgi:hypothetical protein
MLGLQWNGFDLKKTYLDRINRIIRIIFDHFPEENGQTPSPSANEFVSISRFGGQIFPNDNVWVVDAVLFRRRRIGYPNFLQES